jgi:hypothetical protein
VEWHHWDRKWKINNGLGSDLRDDHHNKDIQLINALNTSVDRYIDSQGIIHPSERGPVHPVIMN